MFTPRQVVEILKNVREQIVCPRCQQRLPTGQIEPVELAGNRGVFVCSCAGCSTQTLVTLNIREMRQRIATRSAQATKVTTEKVGPGDVVDFASFIKAFNGDLASQLEPQPQPDPQAQEPPAGA